MLDLEPPPYPAFLPAEDSSAIQAMATTCLQYQSTEDCLALYQSVMTLLATYTRGPLTFETVLWGEKLAFSGIALSHNTCSLNCI